MDLLLLFCFVGCHFQLIHGFSVATEGTLISSKPESEEVRSSAISRKPRKIIRRIHNGMAFLVGVKVGSMLANKGFDVGHGSLAASNTFQLFGKSINSAISLSYGGIGQKIPLLDEIPSNETTAIDGKTRAENDKEDIVHVTVVRNPSPDTIDKLRRISNLSVADQDVIIFDSEPATTTTTAATISPVVSDQVKFVREHNKRVKEVNKEIQRRNSKF